MTARSVARSVAAGQAGDADAVSQFGPELLLNGGFDDASIWEGVANWAIASGVATHTAGSAAALAQTLAARHPPATYRVVFTVSAYTAGQVNLDLWDTLIPGTIIAGTARTANGTYAQDLVAPAEFDRLRIKPDATFAGACDLVSLKRKFY